MSRVVVVVAERGTPERKWIARGINALRYGLRIVSSVDQLSRELDVLGSLAHAVIAVDQGPEALDRLRVLAASLPVVVASTAPKPDGGTIDLPKPWSISGLAQALQSATPPRRGSGPARPALGPRLARP